jgi:hypothetical protein
MLRSDYGFDAIKWLLIGVLILGGILIPLFLIASTTKYYARIYDDHWTDFPYTPYPESTQWAFCRGTYPDGILTAQGSGYDITDYYADLEIWCPYPVLCEDGNYWLSLGELSTCNDSGVGHILYNRTSPNYWTTGTQYTPPAGITPVITASSPNECAWNQSLSWTYDFAGHIEIPTENPNTYTDFILRLYNRQAMEMGLSFIDVELTEFPDLSAGEDWSWDLSDIEIASSTTGYSLTYWLEGYNVNTLQPFRWSLTPVEICGAKTILSDQTESPVSLIPTEWIEMLYEDCDALEGFEKIMCNFTNFVKSIFAPSKAGLDGLSQDIDQIRTKFPFTYISEFVYFITDIKNGVDENKGIDFKILGQEGTVDFGFWESTTSVGGVVQTFSTIFKSFVIFVILIGFVGGWLIPFIRRIL